MTGVWWCGGGDWWGGAVWGNGFRRCVGIVWPGFGGLNRDFVAFEVMVYGGADGLAPIVGSEGVDVFLLGLRDVLREDLGEVDESFGHAGFDVAADDGREKAG